MSLTVFILINYSLWHGDAPKLFLKSFFWGLHQHVLFQDVPKPVIGCLKPVKRPPFQAPLILPSEYDGLQLRCWRFNLLPFCHVDVAQPNNKKIRKVLSNFNHHQSNIRMIYIRVPGLCDVSMSLHHLTMSSPWRRIFLAITVRSHLASLVHQWVRQHSCQTISLSPTTEEQNSSVSPRLQDPFFFPVGSCKRNMFHFHDCGRKNK